MFAFASGMETDVSSQRSYIARRKFGGADRDRTDDIKLAKLALSQLSYSPEIVTLKNGGPGKI